MTEDDARRVLLLRAYENPPGPAPWSEDDRAWATRQAVAAAGEGARPDAFVATRAALALPRLLPRAPEAARWLERRGWHPALVPLALLLGLLAGLAVDQLGPPQRVNLLAPAVWAVVLWNLFVYAALWLPAPQRGLLARLAGRSRHDGALARRGPVRQPGPPGSYRLRILAFASVAPTGFECRSVFCCCITASAARRASSGHSAVARFTAWASSFCPVG